jgi:hypothetical protein
MGMADHYTGGRGWGDGQAAFENHVGPYREANGLFGYHVPP